MLLQRSCFRGYAALRSLYRKEWCKVAAEEEPRINGQIRARSVRLISESGEQLGIKHIREAMDYAERQDLDLVEVAANSDPPVVRIMDYGKYKYQKEQARKAARKKQVNINVREIKLRPKIGDHDFATKRGHVERFLRHGDKVKVTIMFRGREVNTRIWARSSFAGSPATLRISRASRASRTSMVVTWSWSWPQRRTRPPRAMPETSP